MPGLGQLVAALLRVDRDQIIDRELLQVLVERGQLAWQHDRELHAALLRVEVELLEQPDADVRVLRVVVDRGVRASLEIHGHGASVAQAAAASCTSARSCAYQLVTSPRA